MMQFAQVFTDETETVALSLELSWSHIKLLIPINEYSLKTDRATSKSYFVYKRQRKNYK